MIRLGPFELGREIGHGGMGRVFRGVHVARGVAVAVKVLSASSRRLETLFEREVRALASLDHEAIVGVLDHGWIDLDTARGTGDELAAGTPWLAMELVDGRSLVDEVGRMPWRDLRRTAEVLLDALAHAHARDVLHRDLKPGNVLRSATGRVHLIDFGIARLAGDSEQAVAGTPTYMAPEQFEPGRPVGPWTDLYALGCLCSPSPSAGRRSACRERTRGSRSIATGRLRRSRRCGRCPTGSRPGCSGSSRSTPRTASDAPPTPRRAWRRWASPRTPEGSRRARPDRPSRRATRPPRSCRRRPTGGGSTARPPRTRRGSACRPNGRDRPATGR